jgi:hypothetical protein
VGHKQTRLSDGHSRVEAERLCGRTGGGDLHAVADAVNGDDCSLSRLRERVGTRVSPWGISPENHFCRFASPAQFLNAGPLMGGERVYFGLQRLPAGPTCARAPAAAAGARAIGDAFADLGLFARFG